MKKIIFGLGVLLMLVQNGFAASDAEYDELINKYKKHLTLVHVLKCEKEATNHRTDGKVNECLNAIKSIENGKSLEPFSKNKQKYLAESYLNAGVLYHYSGNKLNAYKYYMKAAKLGDLRAQKNLDILCKESPWVCK